MARKHLDIHHELKDKILRFDPTNYAYSQKAINGGLVPPIQSCLLFLYEKSDKIWKS